MVMVQVCMHSDIQNLPDNIPVLKGMIVSFAEEKHCYEERERRYEIENKLLREQVLLMRSKLFGRRTEKLSQEGLQQILFDEPALEKEEKGSYKIDQVIEVPAHVRKKPGRKALPADLPRVEVIHDLKEEEKVCGCGCKMERIGQETSEQLDIVPARMQVIRHIRYKYACKSCEGVESEGPTIKIAPVPEQIIPKSEKINVASSLPDTVAAIKMSALFAKDIANNIKIKISKDLLQISSAAKEIGDTTSRVTARVSGGEIEIAFNARYLIDVLNVLPGDEIKMGFNDDSSPGVIRTDKDKSYLYLVMPLKIDS